MCDQRRVISCRPKKSEVAALLVVLGKVYPLEVAAPAVEEAHALAVAHVVAEVVELAPAAAVEVRACEEGPEVAEVVAYRATS